VCEYCGCQALTAIADLTREHDRVVTLISHVRTAHDSGDFAAMATAARQIAAVLGPHTAVEEHGLFPPLAAEFPDHIADLTAQHRHVDGVLAEATDGMPADPTWPTRLLDTLHLLREHILAEQDGVFPAALTSLDTTDWDAIEEIRARVGTTVANPPAARGRSTLVDAAGEAICDLTGRPPGSDPALSITARPRIARRTHHGEHRH
jgi:Hemerythrin HHE cation binding domain